MSESGRPVTPAAGYDPRAMVNLLTRVGGSAEMDAFRHHPGIGERLDAVQSGISRYKLIRGGQKRLASRFLMMSGRGEPQAQAGEEGMVWQ